MKGLWVSCGLALAYGMFHMPELSVAETQIIEITAQRFHYQPQQVRLPAGQAAQLQIRSKDVLHGFFIPKLNIRADLEPGKTVTVDLPPLSKGVYPFACDIFCGTEHSHMHGSLLVE